MIEKKKIGIVGAMYNIETGKVEFYDQTLYPFFEDNNF
jgi:carbonic anhydrase